MITLSHGPRRDEEFLVTIDRLDESGRGSGSIDALVGPQKQEKRYAFVVAGTLPGDEVRVRATSRKRRKVISSLLEIVTPSPDRVEPICPHFARAGVEKFCGGCSLQAANYNTQIRLKETHLKTLFSDDNTAKFKPMVHAESPTRYRNKVEFSFGDHAGQLMLGFRPPSYHFEVIDHTECFLVPTWVMDLVTRINTWIKKHQFLVVRGGHQWLSTVGIRYGARTGERMVVLETTHAETVLTMDGDLPIEPFLEDFKTEFATEFTTTIWLQRRAVRGEPTTEKDTVLHGSGMIKETLQIGDRAFEFDISRKSFFQTNSAQAERLYGLVRETLHTLAPINQLVDLYCGTGTIGLICADLCEQLVGVEKVESAVIDARANAERHGIENATFIAGDAGEVVKTLKADVVVVDPPRSGLLSNMMKHLIELKPRAIVYVSCQPKSLARDLKLLADEGYAVEWLQPVDLFPQTLHTETVVLLTR